jgi:protein SCO1
MEDENMIKSAQAFLFSGRSISAGPLCLALLLAGGCRPAAPDSAGSPIGRVTTTADGTTAPVEKECCKEGSATYPPSSTGPTLPAAPKLPDVPLRTQRGNSVHFYQDLVRGRVVAINFVFTTCQGICPPLGTNFAAISRRMHDRFGDEFALISVTVDPVHDGPEELDAWSRKFDGDPAWTLVTGEKRDVDQLLKALGVYSADKTQHSPFLLIGDETSGKWARLHGLTSPEKVAETLETMLQARKVAARVAEAAENTSARQYFTDVILQGQEGRPLRLYTDLMRGKVVVVQSFFCSCRAACPSLVTKFTKIQERFRNRMGKDLHLLSISVDPERDSPEVLKAYAQRIGAGPGWFFLTGPNQDVEFALQKFGQKVESRDNHSNLFVIGNNRTGLWKKAMGLSNDEAIIDVVASVLDDPGESESTPPDAKAGQ